MTMATSSTSERDLALRIALLLAAMVGAVLWAVTLDPAVQDRYLSEDGVVEVATAALYGVCVVFALVRGGAAFALRRWYILAVPIVFGLRELDFDKRFTERGVFTSKFYLSGDIPVAEKLIGVAAALVIVAILWKLASRHLRPLVAEPRRHLEMVAGVVIVCGLVGLAITLDGIIRKLRGWTGYSDEEIVGAFPFILKASSIEEVIEMFIPVVLFYLFARFIGRPAPATSTAGG